MISGYVLGDSTMIALTPNTIKVYNYEISNPCARQLSDGVIGVIVNKMGSDYN